MNFSKLGVVATAATLALAAPSYAGLIDFTDDSVGTPGGGVANGPVTGTLSSGVTWTVTSNDNFGLNRDQDYDGGEAVSTMSTAAALTLDNDGFGVSNDEASNVEPLGIFQTITVTFSEAVTILEAVFLDVYADAAGAPSESARMLIAASAADDTAFDASTFGSDANGSGAGDASIVGAYRGTSFTFFAGPGADDATADVSLAALVVAPVPLPAGFLLLGTALGGLTIARRRKNKA